MESKPVINTSTEEQYAFKNGDTVKYLIRYHDDMKEGTGIVRGLATIRLPLQGFGFILEDTSGMFPNDDYPFSCIVIYEAYMEKING